jgi:small-conductance mechanosensitive channel
MEPAIVAASAVLGAVLLGWLCRPLARRFVNRRYPWILLPHRICHRAWGAVLLATALYYALPPATLRRDHLIWLRHLVLVVLIGAIGWLILKILHVLEELVLSRLPEDVANNRRKRTRTQIALVRRLTAAIIVILTIGCVLTTFPPFRTVGRSILLSAGVVGVFVGLAANTTLGYVLAGVQLAFADAVRVDDVLVIDGDWGRVEEVQLTHIVVRMWDERRLIVPSTYFTSKPFQNWTRHEARVLGEVMLHLDYTADLDELRAETQRIVQASPLWDRAQWALQLVEAAPNTLVIQVLASAADGPSAWNLRCELREGLIKFIRDQHPQWLPRSRAQYQP